MLVSDEHLNLVNGIFYFISACGGMDNMCTVYDLNNRDTSGVAKMSRELAGYDGFLSSCRFLNDQKIITGSGDMKMLESFSCKPPS